MDAGELTGKTLGQYELRELYGKGGMGAVYRAYQLNLEREVGFKIISTSRAQDEEYIKRFYREAKTAASLEHPNIVPVYDYGQEGAITYVVMRLLTGGSLSDRMKQKGDSRPSLGEISHLLSQLASALDYAHSRGVVHRDIKSNNIMFDNHGVAYLVDFGIAKLAEDKSQTALTSPDAVMGTPTHMAPEQWRGEDATSVTDLYALGIIVYEMIAGKMPFEANTPFGLMTKHINDAPTPVHHFRQEIPEAVSLVIERALAKNPTQRFQTITAFAQAFDSAIEGVRGQGTQLYTFKLDTKTPSQTPYRPLEDNPTFTPSSGAVIDPSAQVGDGPTMTPSSAIPIRDTKYSEGSDGSEAKTEALPRQRQRLGLGVVVLVVLAIIAAAIIIPNLPEDEAQTTSNTPRIETLREVIVYAGPGGGFDGIRELPANTEFEVLAISADGNWFEVDLGDNETGWVRDSNFIEDKGDMREVAIATFPTQTPTETSRPTNTPTHTSTDRPTETPTNTPTATNTPTDTPTDTPTPTNTPTDTPTPTNTPTVTETFTPTSTSTPTLDPENLSAEVTNERVTLLQAPDRTSETAGLVFQGDVVTILGRMLTEGGEIFLLVEIGNLTGWVPDSQLTMQEGAMELAQAMTLTPTNTPTDTATFTPTPTDTPTVTPTVTPTFTDTPTFTPTFTETPTSTPTVTETAEPATPTPTFTVTPVEGMLATGGIVDLRGATNFYSGPGADFPVVATLDDGSYPILGRVENPDVWYQVQLETGLAWISESAMTATIKPQAEEIIEVAVDPVEIPEYPVSVEIGETFDGVIERNSQGILTFQGQADQVVSIGVTNADFDGVLELYGPDSPIALIVDDDSGGSGNPLINGFNLPTNGEYRVIVRGYSPATAEGSFRISFSQGEVVAPNPTQNITFGQTITEALGNNEIDQWFFKADAQDVISVVVEGSFDSNICVVDSSGLNLICDDDSGGNLNPLIEFFTMPSGGEFSIVLQGYNAAAAGSYQITLLKSSIIDTTNINYGDTLNARLEPGGRTAFTFEGVADDRVTIEVQSEFDSNFELRNELGAVIAADDDSGGDLQPLLTDFRIPSNGTYTIVVAGFSDADSGPFNITLTVRN